MSKLLIVSMLLLLLSCFIYSENYGLQQILTDNNIKVVTKINEKSIFLFDTIKIKGVDVAYRLSYLLKTIEFYLKINEIEINDLPYTYTIIVYQTEDFIIKCDAYWLVTYFKMDSLNRSVVLSKFVDQEMSKFIKQQPANSPRSLR